MRVYRVETAAGNGPYYDGWVYGSGNVGLNKLSQRPNPYNEGIMEYKNKISHRCGFTCRSKLQRWFRPYKEGLEAGRCCMMIYEVPEEAVLKGKRQVVFEIDKATLISKEPLPL